MVCMCVRGSGREERINLSLSFYKWRKKRVFNAFLNIEVKLVTVYESI